MICIHQAQQVTGEGSNTAGLMSIRGAGQKIFRCMLILCVGRIGKVCVEAFNCLVYYLDMVLN